MNEWFNELINEYMNEYMYESINKLMNEWINQPIIVRPPKINNVVHNSHPSLKQILSQSDKRKSEQETRAQLWLPKYGFLIMYDFLTAEETNHEWNLFLLIIFQWMIIC